MACTSRPSSSQTIPALASRVPEVCPPRRFPDFLQELQAQRALTPHHGNGWQRGGICGLILFQRLRLCMLVSWRCRQSGALSGVGLPVQAPWSPCRRGASSRRKRHTHSFILAVAKVKHQMSCRCLQLETITVVGCWWQSRPLVTLF